MIRGAQIADRQIPPPRLAAGAALAVIFRTEDALKRTREAYDVGFSAAAS